jgi:nucleotide-binding universal stress UspA family protein
MTGGALMKILIALDESSYSQAALHSVLARPWPEGSLFKVLSVVEPFHPEYAGWQTTYTPVALEAQKSIQSSSVKLVEESERALAAAFGAAQVSGEVTEGYIKDRILDEAISWQADLIVVGSHGRRGFTKFLLGSVSEAIASHANCSVEIVRRKPVPQEPLESSKGTETEFEQGSDVKPE